MYVKSGHKTMVHVMRKEYIKAYHIPKKKTLEYYTPLI